MRSGRDGGRRGSTTGARPFVCVRSHAAPVAERFTRHATNGDACRAELRGVDTIWTRPAQIQTGSADQNRTTRDSRTARTPLIFCGRTAHPAHAFPAAPKSAHPKFRLPPPCPTAQQRPIAWRLQGERGARVHAVGYCTDCDGRRGRPLASTLAPHRRDQPNTEQLGWWARNAHHPSSTAYPGSVHFWLAPAWQSQMCTPAPFAAPPPTVSRHRPLAGL